MTDEEDDWTFFRRHRDRCYRCRLATPAELASLEANHAMPRMAPGCFVYALSRIRRDAGRIETILQVREPEPELDEVECMGEWFNADAVITALVVNAADGDHRPSGARL